MLPPMDDPSYWKKVIRDPETGEPYLIRWNWRPCKWFSLKLHHIVRHDYGRDPHDHPWWFVSLILWGSYTEEYVGPFGNLLRRRVRWLNLKKATGTHRIIEVHGNVWTLVLNGPRVREWGFHTALGWVPWYKYIGESK